MRFYASVFFVNNLKVKKIKQFLFEDFNGLPLVSTIPVVNIKLLISLRIFENIRNGPNGILWGLGETYP